MAMKGDMLPEVRREVATIPPTDIESPMATI